MTDSKKFERLAAKHDRIDRERLEGVRRWVEYIENNPPDVWGPQQNAIVDSQLESAQEAGHDAAHERHVRAVAGRLAEEQ